MDQNSVPDFFRDAPTPTTPQQKPPMATSTKVLLVALGVILLAGAVVVPIILMNKKDGTTSQVSESEEDSTRAIGDAFLEAVTDNDGDTAYAFMAASFTEYTDREDFEDYITDIQDRTTIDAPKFVSSEADEDDEEPGRFIVLTYSLGEDVTINIYLEQEEGEWKITDVFTSSPSDTPAEDSTSEVDGE